MRSNKIKNTIIALVMAAAVGASATAGYFCKVDSVPELVSYVDAYEGYEIEDEEVPLGVKPVVTTKTTTKTTTKKKTLATKAKKTKSTTKKTTTTSSKTTRNSTSTVKCDTTKLTTTVTSDVKNSKTETIKTTVKTTVTTTTTPIATAAAKSEVAVRTIAPKAHENVLSAYEQLGMKVIVDPSVSYSGQFDATSRTITVRKNSDEAIYHELGHFVAFVAGNADLTSEFSAIYKEEKSKLVATRNNYEYVTSTPSEYFAESYQDYVENPSKLQSSRPKTYAYIAAKTAMATSARCTLMLQVFAAYWN